MSRDDEGAEDLTAQRSLESILGSFRGQMSRDDEGAEDVTAQCPSEEFVSIPMFGIRAGPSVWDSEEEICEVVPIPREASREGGEEFVSILSSMRGRSR
jgi:hypothetical protein